MKVNSQNTPQTDRAITWQPFLLLYTLITAADVMVLSFDMPHLYREITKPLILISLMVFFIWKSYPINTKKQWLFLFGLFFSFLGDGFLNYEGYFLQGLFAFFTAHLFYILAFTFPKRLSSIWKTAIPYLTLSYALGIFILLNPHLGTLKPYVILYMLVLVTLVLSLLTRNGMVGKAAYITGLTGGFLFLLSDSILAINKFAFHIPMGSQLIMITYAFAQLLLLKSFLEARS